MSDFNLKGKEPERAERFIKQHRKCVENSPSIVGGNFSFIFTPTGVNCAVSIKCKSCGETLNITDYDKW